MNLLEDLYQQEWEKDIRFNATASKLIFRSYNARPLKNEHDRITVWPTLDTENCNTAIGFAQGKNDNWATYVYRQVGTEVQVANVVDVFYFSRLGLLAIGFTRDKVWRDIQTIYAMTTDSINQNCLDEIKRIAQTYTDNIEMAYMCFIMVYYGMIAEEHWQANRGGQIIYTKLGKLLKYHSLYRYFIDRIDTHTVTTECCDVSPAVIAESAKAKGLSRDVTWEGYTSPYDDASLLPRK